MDMIIELIVKISLPPKIYHKMFKFILKLLE